VPRYLRELFLGCVRQFNAHSRSVPHPGEQSRPIYDSRPGLATEGRNMRNPCTRMPTLVWAAAS
jgi:hypothetical protein